MPNGRKTGCNPCCRMWGPLSIHVSRCSTLVSLRGHRRVYRAGGRFLPMPGMQGREPAAPKLNRFLEVTHGVVGSVIGVGLDVL